MTWRSNKTLTEPAADFTVLQFAFQNGELWPIAVLLLDNQDRLHVRSRSTADLATRIPPEEVDVVALSLPKSLRTPGLAVARKFSKLLKTD